MVDRKTTVVHATIASTIGWTLAALAYFLVFVFTGNSDIMFAAGAGLVSVTVIWLGLHARHSRPDQ